MAGRDRGPSREQILEQIDARRRPFPVGAAPGQRRLGHHRRLAPEHVHENAQAAGVTLDQSTLDAIDAALEPVAVR